MDCLRSFFILNFNPMPRAPRMKITESDAKKLRPLTRYWKNKLSRDNWIILSLGVVLGFALGLIV